jgi:hypothetical protein
MIDANGFNVTLVQHEAVFGPTSDLNKTYFATRCTIENGRLLVHCVDGTELNCPQDKVSFIIKPKKEHVK